MQRSGLGLFSFRVVWHIVTLWVVGPVADPGRAVTCPACHSRLYFRLHLPLGHGHSPTWLRRSCAAPTIEHLARRRRLGRQASRVSHLFLCAFAAQVSVASVNADHCSVLVVEQSFALHTSFEPLTEVTSPLNHLPLRTRNGVLGLAHNVFGFPASPGCRVAARGR